MKTLDLLEAQGLTSTTSPFFINNDFENLSIGEELVINFDYEPGEFIHQLNEKYQDHFTWHYIEEGV